ncbi:MAG: signal peptidase II [Deltaproteobacteria bacterium]|nr:signal peptidase II [Deltaproteobacteria bacterium]
MFQNAKKIKNHPGLKTALVTAVAVAALDQLTKLAIVGAMRPNQVIEAVPGLLDIVFFKNTGAAFGIFTDGGWVRTALLAATSVAAIVVMGFLIYQSRSALMTYALSLIVGGAAGNLIDRVRLGAVVDFIYFHAGKYYWPAFNVADSAITIGVFLALIAYMKEQRE